LLSILRESASQAFEENQVQAAETLADPYKGKIPLARVNAYHPAGYSKYQEGQPLFEAHRSCMEYSFPPIAAE
jgi:hypothetical protein